MSHDEKDCVNCATPEKDRSDKATNDGEFRVVTGAGGTRSLTLFKPGGGYCSITLDEGEVAMLDSTKDAANAWEWSPDGFESLLRCLEEGSGRKPRTSDATPPTREDRDDPTWLRGVSHGLEAAASAVAEFGEGAIPIIYEKRDAVDQRVMQLVRDRVRQFAAEQRSAEATHVIPYPREIIKEAIKDLTLADETDRPFLVVAIQELIDRAISEGHRRERDLPPTGPDGKTAAESHCATCVRCQAYRKMADDEAKRLGDDLAGAQIVAISAVEQQEIAIRRAEEAEAEIARLRKVIFDIDHVTMNAESPGDLYDAVRDACATEIVKGPWRSSCPAPTQDAKEKP